jgi:hypothetical protein
MGIIGSFLVSNFSLGVVNERSKTMLSAFSRQLSANHSRAEG